MKTHIVRLAILVLLFNSSALRAQEVDPKAAAFQKDLIDKAQNHYRQFFKDPVEVQEYWAALDFEISLGKFELAGFWLRKVLEKEPKAKVDEEFLKMQEALGFKPFYRLRDVKKWSNNEDFEKECRGNVDSLIKRLTDSVEKTLSDPQRIRKFIALLDAPTKAERESAYVQLNRSREKAVPLMLDTISNNAGKPLRTRVIEAFARMDEELVVRLFEILKAVDDEDAKDANLRLAVLEIFRRRADMRCIPYLWYLSSSERYPLEVRSTARSALAYLREEDASKLPPAKWMLTELAEKCYRHKLKVPSGGKPIWHWDGKILAPDPEYYSKRNAENYFGLRYAREALELDPAYKPAQTVLLNFFLERMFDRDLDKFFLKPIHPDMQQLLLSQDPEFLMSLLNRAVTDDNVPVMLPLIEILGTRGELRAAQSTLGNPPRGLLRGLYYPDRRVQFATATALLKMPYRGAPADAMRVVEVLRRFLAAEPVSRTMVAMCPKEQQLQTEKIFKDGQFQHLDVHSGTLNEIFEKLRRSADYEVIFIHPAVKAKELPFVVTQLRGDADVGRLPLIILSPKDNVAKWRKLFERHPNTWVELDTFFAMPEAMKKLAEDKIDETGGGYKSPLFGYRLSVEERKKFAEDSMKFLWQMGKGEITGYNVLHAQDTLRATLHRGGTIEVNGKKRELAELALETAALNPDRDTQLWLANVFFDPAFEKLKMTAIVELRQHILKNGLSLEKHHIANLKDAQKAADTPELSMQLTLILGNLRLSPQGAGKKLNQFNPPLGP